MLKKPGRCCVILGVHRSVPGFGISIVKTAVWPGHSFMLSWYGGRPCTRRSRARSPSSSPRYAPCRLTAMKPRTMIGTLSATRNQRRRIGPEAHHAEVRGHDDEAAQNSGGISAAPDRARSSSSRAPGPAHAERDV